MATLNDVRGLYPGIQDLQLAVCLAFMDGLLNLDELDALFERASMEV